MVGAPPPDGATGRVYAVARPVPAGDGEAFDCTVLDGDGRVILRVEGYRTVALPGAIPAGRARAAADRDVRGGRRAVTTIRRLAIVNRGECAMRALTAVAELNLQSGEASPATRITTVAVYMDADADAWFVREADEAICLGSTTYLDPADGHRRSRYLDEPGVVAALVQAEVDAVWVGWGFVAERASFAQLCEEAGITFVGPDSSTIRLLGDKVTAKRMAEKADVPVVPWSGGPVDDVAQAAEEARAAGLPGGAQGHRRRRRPGHPCRP